MVGLLYRLQTWDHNYNNDLAICTWKGDKQMVGDRSGPSLMYCFLCDRKLQIPWQALRLQLAELACCGAALEQECWIHKHNPDL